MKPKIKKVITRIHWTVTIIFIVFLILFGGIKDLTIGRMHRKANDLFSFQRDLTEVHILLLMGSEEQKTKETFPIKPYSQDAPVYGKIILKGKDLSDFADHWEFQDVGYNKQSLCHNPAYGFRLFKGNSLVGETSICWSCNNFYIDVYPGLSVWYGFSAGSKQAQKLLKYCDSKLPYHRTIKKVEQED